MRAKKYSLRDRAYRYLLGELKNQRLVPGDMVNRRLIAAKLHISVAPVLEAILQLESEGLLETVPRKGTLVRALKQPEVWGNMMLREALECQAARIYCGTPIRRNQDRLQKMAQVLDATEIQMQIWPKEVLFHRELFNLTKCPPLIEAYDRVMRTSLFLQVNLFTHPHSKPKIIQHTTLLRKLRTDQPDEAETFIRTHLNDIQSGII